MGHPWSAKVALVFLGTMSNLVLKLAEARLAEITHFGEAQSIRVTLVTTGMQYFIRLQLL